ncbi:hypothetical protein HPB50_009526 [Hyalomma asiaticum]|uniref:Uncharacterized protein n=1 Tax=Hyalomma asiaticum TaxID=266040 RepID=A0ACB7TFB9_HYAAI|nr:hypothetical protein HPB50_009526 [Hyalomma asiaticum]
MEVLRITDPVIQAIFSYSWLDLVNVPTNVLTFRAVVVHTRVPSEDVIRAGIHGSLRPKFFPQIGHPPVPHRDQDSQVKTAVRETLMAPLRCSHLCHVCFRRPMDILR